VCNPLYCLRSCATTLYRTSQYLSILLYVLHTSSSTRSVSYTHLAPLPYYSPSFYQDRLCPTHTNSVSRVYSTVLFAIPRHYYITALIYKINSLFDIYISASILLFCPLSSGTSSLLKSEGPTKGPTEVLLLVLHDTCSLFLH
jgi:hypothetical protein